MSLDLCSPRLLNAARTFYTLRHILRTHRSDVQQARQHRSRFYSELWSEAAASIGASTQELGNDILEIRQDDRCTYVQQNTTSLDSLITVSIAARKQIVHRLLARHGLITPPYCEFTLQTAAKAVAFLDGMEGDCVVKPASGGGGEGVTTGVRSHFDLFRAMTSARVFDTDLLIEKQIRGDVYRLLYLDGKLLDAVLRKPSVVTGDGKATVHELLNRENQLRVQKGANVAHVMISIDMDMHRTLAAQELTLSSVPKEGRTVRLKTVINENSRQDNISAGRLLCNSIVADGAAAAAAVGVRLAGIDIVTPDPSLPLADSGGAILEVNATPSYQHHYFKRDGSFPVAVHVLPTLLARENNLSSVGSAAA
jgi:cyanophycin synthetase